MKIDTVADVEAYIAFKRVTDAFCSEISRIMERGKRDFEAELARVKLLRDKEKL